LKTQQEVHHESSCTECVGWRFWGGGRGDLSRF